MVRFAAITFGLLSVLFIGALIYGMNAEAPAPAPVADRIEAACEREYPYDERGRASCKLSLLMAHLEAEERARLDRAARAAF